MLEYLMSEFTFGFELEAIFNPLKLDKEYEEIYKIKGKNKRETLKLKLDLYKKIISKRDKLYKNTIKWIEEYWEQKK